MRILIYWEQEAWGGVDNHLFELLSSWPSKEDEFVVIVNKGNAGFLRMKSMFLSLANVRCVEIPSYSYNEINRKLRKHSFLKSLRWLFYFLQPLIFVVTITSLYHHFRREGEFDLLLADNGGYPAAWGAICSLGAAKRLNIKSRLMLIHHSSTPPRIAMGYYEYFVDRFVTRNATALICVSKATRDSLLLNRSIDNTKLRVRVIYNGLTVKNYIPNDSVADLRSLISASANDSLVGVVGRVSPYKGQEDLIFAFSRLQKNIQSRIQIVFVGSGDPDSEITRLKDLALNLGVGERVHFLGFVSGEPRDLISQLDLLLVTTRSFEGFGLTLIEAMSVDTPVIATSVGAIPEFLTPDIGVLVSPNSPKDISVQLLDFIDNPETWSSRSNVARKKMYESTNNMSQEYYQLFKECNACSEL